MCGVFDFSCRLCLVVRFRDTFALRLLFRGVFALQAPHLFHMKFTLLFVCPRHVCLLSDAPLSMSERCPCFESTAPFSYEIRISICDLCLRVTDVSFSMSMIFVFVCDGNLIPMSEQHCFVMNVMLSSGKYSFILCQRLSLLFAMRVYFFIISVALKYESLPCKQTSTPKVYVG